MLNFSGSAFAVCNKVDSAPGRVDQVLNLISKEDKIIEVWPHTAKIALLGKSSVLKHQQYCIYMLVELLFPQSSNNGEAKIYLFPLYSYFHALLFIGVLKKKYIYTYI